MLSAGFAKPRIKRNLFQGSCLHFFTFYTKDMKSRKPQDERPQTFTITKMDFFGFFVITWLCSADTTWNFNRNFLINKTVKGENAAVGLFHSDISRGVAELKNAEAWDAGKK